MHPRTVESQSDLLEAVRARIRAQLEDAQAKATALAGEDLPDRGIGESDDGIVQATVDRQGLLVDAQFGPQIVDLSPEELRENLLSALAAARRDLTGGVTPRRPDPSMLADTSTIDALDDIINGRL